MRRLRSHRTGSQEGSIMLLGLAFLGVVVVPLIAILVYASQASTATQTARGASISAAYSGLSRSVDMQATLEAEQPQLYPVGSPGLAAAETENEAAVESMWRYSNFSAALGAGVTARAPDLANWGGYSKTATSSPPGSLGVVNIRESPDDAASDPSVNFSCTAPEGFKSTGTGPALSTLCWVDHRAINATGERTRVNITNDTWNHFSSGVETQVQINVPSLFRFETPFEPTFRSSASFAQPCLGGDCAQ